MLSFSRLRSNQNDCNASILQILVAYLLSYGLIVQIVINLACIDRLVVEDVVLRIELEGEYQSLESFLAWLEGNERLFRMDSARIAPSRYSTEQLVMQLNLLGLKN